MGLRRDIESLNPKLQPLAHKLIEECQKAGVFISLSETLREVETQAVYYLRGRVDTSDQKIVQALQILGRKHAWLFSAGEVAQKVTWTLDSNHLSGDAFDIIVYNEKHQKDWNYSGENWQKVISIAKEIGLKCGADWDKKDYPHMYI